jgi:2-amino-4-hydroxy-6-hydroxymethyldihydropteridine diphosphokinase
VNDNAGAAVSAFVGLGSNLDDPASQIERALAKIRDLPETEVFSVSSLYRSAPFGGVEQPDFLNAVAQLQSALDATELLRHLLRIEESHGRVRSERWGPRNIDLDLLVFGDVIIDSDQLKLPHPGIAERNFVLLPLQEIAPDLVISGLGKVADLAVDWNEPRISRIE